MRKTIKKYIRDQDRNPIGVMRGLKLGKKAFIGYSKVNTKDGDKFDKYVGDAIASKRLMDAVEGRGNKAKNPKDFEDYVAYQIRQELLDFALVCQEDFDVPLKNIKFG